MLKYLIEHDPREAIAQFNKWMAGKGRYGYVH